MTSPFPTVGQRLSERCLSRRLDALAELIMIGRARQGQDEDKPSAQGQNDEAVAGFGKGLLDDADSVLKRAGERLRLSSSHTVIALAGGTGSGKSTLFNALSGATFSPPGVTRPTTSQSRSLPVRRMRTISHNASAQPGRPNVVVLSR